jgi:hypothetical protein
MIEMAKSSSSVSMSYNDALLYCQFLDHGGHKDWRMPTEAEHEEHHLYGWWYTNDERIRITEAKLKVMPVRTI